MEFEAGQHVWLTIKDFKMFDGLGPCFIVMYVRPYEIIAKPNPNVYTLKLLTSFLAHQTFHALKLKLFAKDEKKTRLEEKNVTIN